MSLTLERMRALLRLGLGGLDDADLPNMEADELLNMALWEISNNFGFKEKELRLNTETVVDTREIPLPNELDALISIAVLNDAGQWNKLERMSAPEEDETQFAGTATQDELTQIPEKYYRRNRTLVLQPTPDAVYPVRISMQRTVASLLEGTVETTGLPRNWDELVVEGAVVRGHFYNQDYTLGQQATSLQVGKLRSTVETVGKEEKGDSRYARLRVIDDVPGAEDDGPLFST